MIRISRLFIVVGVVVALAVMSPDVTVSQTPETLECPVTLPNTDDLHGLPGFLGDGKVYSEDGLWLAIPADGSFEFDPDIHSLSDNPEYSGWMGFKLHLHRGEGVRGFVTVTGDRLDDESGVQAENDPYFDEFYGERGFVPVALMIPEAGCWEFTATVGDSSATWVMEVRIVNEIATPVD